MALPGKTIPGVEHRFTQEWGKVNVALLTCAHAGTKAWAISAGRKPMRVNSKESLPYFSYNFEWYLLGMMLLNACI